MHTVNTEFSNLSDEAINQILDKSGLEKIGDGYVRLWPDSVQIDADLSLKELQALIEIMQEHLKLVEKEL